MYNELEGDIIYDMLHEFAMIIAGKEKMMAGSRMIKIGRILEVHPLDVKYRRREMLEGYTCQTCADRPDLWDNRDGLEGFLTGEIQMRNSNEEGKRDSWINYTDFFLAVKIEWIATFPEELLDTYEGGDV